MSFQKTAALNVEADCTIAAEGWIHQATTTGCCRPSADAGRTFRNRPFDAAPMAFAQG